MRIDDDDIAEELGAAIRLGTVAEVDLSAARIVVDTGDLQTSAIRWIENRAGATRSWSPPSVGEQVVLLCQGGEIAGAVALRGLGQDAFPPPGDSLRELVSFSDGAVLAYDPEAHALEALLPAGATVTIVARGGVSIDVGDAAVAIRGNVSIDGDLSLTGDATIDGDAVAGGVSLQHHKHAGVQPGGGQSGEPA